MKIISSESTYQRLRKSVAMSILRASSLSLQNVSLNSPPCLHQGQSIHFNHREQVRITLPFPPISLFRACLLGYLSGFRIYSVWISR